MGGDIGPTLAGWAAGTADSGACADGGGVMVGELGDMLAGMLAGAACVGAKVAAVPDALGCGAIGGCAAAAGVAGEYNGGCGATTGCGCGCG